MSRLGLILSDECLSVRPTGSSLLLFCGFESPPELVLLLVLEIQILF